MREGIMSRSGKTPANPANSAVSVPNADVTITYAPGRITLGNIVWSYNATPTGGRLTVTGGGWNVDVDIIVGGPGFIPFDFGEYAVDNNDVVITLYAGGAGVVGKLNVLGRGIV
jgi:hypothetical protein